MLYILQGNAHDLLLAFNQECMIAESTGDYAASYFETGSATS